MEKKEKNEAVTSTLLDNVRKWQEESPENRNIFCIVCEDNRVSSSIQGPGKNLLNTLCSVMEKDPDIMLLLMTAMKTFTLYTMLGSIADQNK